MTLADLMKRSHTAVCSGYNHQSNIGLISALVLGNAKAVNKPVLLDNLKRRPNQLVNVTFNLIDSLKGECDRRDDHNSYELLDVWTRIHDRQVVVLESPVNDDTCAPENIDNIPFQVRYQTSPCDLNQPIVLWETHLLDDDDNARVHFHTVLKVTKNITAALLESNAESTYKRLIKSIRTLYDEKDLPFSFSSTDFESEFSKWLQRLDNTRGAYKWVDGRPLPQDPLTQSDIIKALDKVKDDKRRLREQHKRFKKACVNRKLADSFLHVSKALYPSQYNNRMKRHLEWCTECNPEMCSFDECDSDECDSDDCMKL